VVLSHCIVLELEEDEKGKPDVGERKSGLPRGKRLVEDYRSHGLDGDIAVKRKHSTC